MHNTKLSIVRTISLVLVTTFFLQELTFAAPLQGILPAPGQNSLTLIAQNPTLFEPPMDFALLKEVHSGRDGILIIHIQDPHTNLSGQENLAGALDAIMTKYGASLVLSEGGEGDCFLDHLIFNFQLTNKPSNHSFSNDRLGISISNVPFSQFLSDQ